MPGRRRTILDLIPEVDDLRWGKHHALIFWHTGKHGWGLYWLRGGVRMDPVYKKTPLQIQEAAWELIDEIESQLSGTWEVVE